MHRAPPRQRMARRLIWLASEAAPLLLWLPKARGSHAYQASHARLAIPHQLLWLFWTGKESSCYASARPETKGLQHAGGLGRGKEQLVALPQILTSLCLVADTTLSPSCEGTPLPWRGSTGKSQKWGVLVALTKEVALGGAFTPPTQRGTYVATLSSLGPYSKFNIKILPTEQWIIRKTKSTTSTFGTLQVPSWLCVSKSALTFPVGASAPPVPCPCTQFMPCATLQHHAACAGHSRIRNGVGENKPNAVNAPSHPRWLKQRLARVQVLAFPCFFTSSPTLPPPPLCLL